MTGILDRALAPHPDRQLALFGEPAARAADPATSHEAAGRVRPSADARVRTVAAIVKGLGTATADDVVLETQQLQHQGDPLRSTIHAAVSRAAKLGLIVPCGKRASKLTGSQMTVYRSPK